MRLLQSKFTMLIGIGIIVISNAFALVGVSYNRSGEPQSTIMLTERELALPYSYGFAEENSGIALRLNYRTYSESDILSLYNYKYYGGKPDWLKINKLLELGFDVNDSPDKKETIRRYSKILPREVLLVIEFNGATYQKALKRAEKNWKKANGLHENEPENSDHTKVEERAKSSFLREQNSTSRLFIIDAGLEHDALRKKYSDYTRYLIVPGSVRLSIDGSKSGFEQLSAYIDDVTIDRVNVPYDYRHVLEPMVSGNARNKPEDKPRYAAKLVYGKRLEPWIERVELIN